MPWSRSLRFVIALALAASFATLAFAEQPPTGRMTVVSAPINPGDDGPIDVTLTGAEYFPIAAKWGVITAASKSGGASLWCAGAALPYAYSAVPASYWPLYPGFGYRLTSTEAVKLVGTTPVSLMRKNDGNPISSSSVVKNATTGELYPKTTYAFDIDEFEFPTVARSVTSTMPTGTTVNVAYTWPTNGTFSTANLKSTELAQFYDSWLSFYYLMPSLGYADGQAFSVRWSDPTSDALKHSDFNIPTTSTWTQREYHIGTDYYPLSRREGWIEFGFNTLHNSYRGQGPAIDEILITGYKYGPVENLQGAYTGSGVTLTWGKPNRTPVSATDDDRPLTYRVWRKIITESAWTEATSVRATETSFVDSGAVPGNTYDYLVQAWDTGAGNGYGYTATTRIAVNTAADSTAPVISYSGVANGQTYASWVTPSFSAVDNVGVTSLSATLNGAAFASGTTITKSGSYKLVITARDAKGNSSTQSVAFTVALPVVKTKVSLGTPIAPKTMKKNKGYNVYGSLKPRHTSGTKPVRIYKYKKVKSGGKWIYKSYGYTTAKVYNYSSYSRYKATIKLTSKGTWRLRAYAPADSKHLATWSSKYDYVTVK